jgi:hypothetical protein
MISPRTATKHRNLAMAVSRCTKESLSHPPYLRKAAGRIVNVLTRS